MHETSQPCNLCGKPAGLLCDYRIGVAPRGPSPTCDMRLCRGCAVLRGSAIVCRRGRGGGCSNHTVDYCPGHAALADRFPEGIGILVPADAERVRREFHASEREKRKPAVDPVRS